jgi:hypothetical protein
MSEIVRPTRDGIHGREYISTQLDLGRKPMALAFDADGNLLSPTNPLVEIPLPVVFDRLPWSPSRETMDRARLHGAKTLGTYALIAHSDWGPYLEGFLDHTMLFLDRDPGGLDPWLVRGLRLAEVDDGPEALVWRDKLKTLNPELVVAIRMPFSSNAGGRAIELAREGAEVLHLWADECGREQGESPRFIKECMKDVHVHLIEVGLRDQISILAGGGIAMAEHMAKLIICGADGVSVDIPLLVAMECRVCRRCAEGLSCPVSIEEADPRWGGARIRNLMAGWHSQLLEVMGAMGLREVRRLRGELGRAMFFEDLERDFFASLGRRG